MAMSQVALVTGTSSGLGASTAALLAQAGFHVVATMRDLARAGPLQTRAKEMGVQLDVRRLDVQDDACIVACVGELLGQHGRIDVLVNNAGAGYLGTLEMTPFDALQQTMDVDFFGVWRVTAAVFPSMRAAGSGRIISVSSIAGLIAMPFSEAYCAAKFAVEGLMESLAPVARHFGVHVSLVEPGAVHTGFVDAVRARFMASAQPAREVYGPLLAAYVTRVNETFAGTGQTADEVARVIVGAATDAVPHFRYVTSDYVRDRVRAKYVDPTGDSVVAAAAARIAGHPPGGPPWAS
jgi:NAD(P)-dependent dehydrogenase (short-subunit alcohol dehydrogenase family)